MGVTFSISNIQLSTIFISHPPHYTHHTSLQSLSHPQITQHKQGSDTESSSLPPLLRSSSLMTPKLLFSLLFLSHSFLLSSLLGLASADDPKMGDCVPKSCGPLSISYPFWLSGQQPPYCGYPQFELHCRYDTVVFYEKYFIEKLFYQNQSLLVGNFNWSFYDCPLPTSNISFDLMSLKVSSANRDLFFFRNCTNSPPGYYRVPCAKDNIFSYLGGNHQTSEHLDFSSNCESTVVPILGYPGADGSNIKSLLKNGFLLEWTAFDCTACRESHGQCGYNVERDEFMCICRDGTHLVKCGGIFTNKKMIIGGIFTNKKMIIGLTTGVGIFLFVCLLFFLYLRWHKRMYSTNIFGKKNSLGAHTIEAAIGKYESLAPKRYKYSDVKKITKSFHDKLGQGGYGIVFKGSLKDGRLVAVKVLNDSKENGAEFINEVSSIGWTSHVNVVSLLGFCFEGSKRALIYEFMHNGSLEKYIYSESAKSTLGWENLYRIAIGIARGLEYLHHGCNTRMVHFDIKPQNILLDNEFCPKISDFGLAKLCSPKDSKLSMPVPRGTIGYIAPEVFSRNFGAASSKSDVYSYGMMVLDMVGARNNKNTRVENTSETYFPDWIYSHLEHDGDLEAWGVTNETQEIAKKLIIVGLWCIQMLPRNRPSMSMVIEMLEGSISDLKVPPKEYLSSTLESLFGTSSTWVSGDASGCM